jgi:transcriptional regulator with XRE-family HTH domain
MRETLTDAIKRAVSREVRALTAGRTQRDVAKLLGISQARVSEIIARKTSVSVETLVALRNVVQRPIDEILDLPPLQRLEQSREEPVPESRQTPTPRLPSGSQKTSQKTRIVSKK